MQCNFGVLNWYQTLQIHPCSLQDCVHGFVQVKRSKVLLYVVPPVTVRYKELLFIILKVLLHIVELPSLNSVELIIEHGGDVVINNVPPLYSMRFNHIIVVLNESIDFSRGFLILAIILFVRRGMLSLRDIILTGCSFLGAEHLLRDVYPHDYNLI